MGVCRSRNVDTHMVGPAIPLRRFRAAVRRVLVFLRTRKWWGQSGKGWQAWAKVCVRASAEEKQVWAKVGRRLRPFSALFNHVRRNRAGRLEYGSEEKESRRQRGARLSPKEGGHEITAQEHESSQHDPSSAAD